MKNIAWVGGSDARHLDAKDLAKAGVDLSNAKEQSFIFQRRVAQEVTNEVAAALMENPGLFGAFELTEAEEGETLDFESLDKTEAAKPAKAGGESLDTPQTGVDAAAPRRTARASTSSAS